MMLANTQAGDRLSVSVVICAYTLDRWDDLLAAVASVAEQTQPAEQILVVIDHNAVLLERAQAALPHATVIANREARGLSGARNTGVAAARGEIIAFLDEDATAAPDWLERLASAYHDPQVLGVGGAIWAQWEGGRPEWFPEEFDWVVGCTYRGLRQSAGPVRNLIGCNMSFRRRVFAAVGGFTTGMGRIGAVPLGCEETELCIRVLQQLPGAVLWYEPAAQVLHRVPQSRARWAYFKARCYAEGVSKSQVTHRVGSGDGLATERAYTLRVLPAAVLRGVGKLVTGNLVGGQRAAAVVAGLAATALGYASGRMAPALRTVPVAQGVQSVNEWQ